MAPFFAGPSRVVFTKLFFMTLPVTSEAVNWHSEATDMASMISLTAEGAVWYIYVILTLEMIAFTGESLCFVMSRVLLLRWRPCLVTWLPRSSVDVQRPTGPTGNWSRGGGGGGGGGRGGGGGGWQEGAWDAFESGTLSYALHGSRSGMIARPPLALGFGSQPGRCVRPMQQHAVLLNFRLLMRRSVPSLDKWSPSIDKSSSFKSPFRHRKLSWLLTKRQPVSSAIAFTVHLR